MTRTDLARLGRRLFEDEQAARAGRPLTEEVPGFTLGDAYAVQKASPQAKDLERLELGGFDYADRGYPLRAPRS